MNDYLRLLFRILCQREGSNEAQKHFMKKPSELDEYFAVNYHVFAPDAPTVVLYEFATAMGGENSKTLYRAFRAFQTASRNYSNLVISRKWTGYSLYLTFVQKT